MKSVKISKIRLFWTSRN